jgi:hypothetical protein
VPDKRLREAATEIQDQTMTAAPSFSAPMTSPAPIATAAEAEKVIAHFLEVMDKLVGVLRQETDLVRGGRLAQAAALAQPKADLTSLYIAAALRLRASQTHLSRIIPDRLAALRRHHDTFRTLLQINLTVLATAHAVSEGIVRGVNAEVQRRNIPNTYTAAGQRAAPTARQIRPLAVSRSL